MGPTPVEMGPTPVEMGPTPVEMGPTPVSNPRPQRKISNIAKRKSIRPPTPRPDRCALFLAFIY